MYIFVVVLCLFCFVSVPWLVFMCVFCHKIAIWSGYISGPAGPIMLNINGPLDHLFCHKWSGQNIYR